MKHSQINMLRGPLLPNIISYTVPIILTGLLQLLFNAADLIVVGQFRGSVSLAAVGATGSITNLVINLFMGLSVGVSVVVAHGLGAHEDTQVHRTVHTALPTGILCGLFLTAIGVLLSKQLLTWMGTPEDILPLSVRYMQIYFCGMPFNIVYNYCASILRAAGDTKRPLLFLSFAGVINVVLNLVFVIFLGMNVEGVALATILAQGISAVLVVLALIRRTDICKLELRKIRIYKPQLIRILRIGLPAGIQASLFSVSNVFMQSSINSFGEIVMSGNAAAINIESFVYTSLSSFQQTCVNFAGQNAGAHQYRRVLRIFWICLACVAVMGITVCSVTRAFGEQLLGIYITDSQEAIRYGILRFGIVLANYTLNGLADVTTGVLRGLGNSFAPMLISILGICVFRIGWITMVFPLPQFHTLECLYLSYPLSWGVTFIIQTFAFLIVYRKHIRQDAQPSTI